MCTLAFTSWHFGIKIKYYLWDVPELYSIGRQMSKDNSWCWMADNNFFTFLFIVVGGLKVGWSRWSLRWWLKQQDSLCGAYVVLLWVSYIFPPSWRYRLLQLYSVDSDNEMEGIDVWPSGGRSIGACCGETEPSSAHLQNVVLTGIASEGTYYIHQVYEDDMPMILMSIVLSVYCWLYSATTGIIVHMNKAVKIITSVKTLVVKKWIH